MRVQTDDLMAFVSFLAVLGLIANFLYLKHKRTVLRHTERMAALDKGVTLPDLEDRSRSAAWSPRMYLLRGMLWLFSGVALSLMLLSVSMAARHDVQPTRKLYEVKRMRELGATEDQVQLYMRTRLTDGVSPAVASLGLVPIGVGLAYLLFYRKEQQAGPEA